MSFAGVANGEKSRIYADAMDETEIMLIPANQVETLLAKLPAFGKLFPKQYQNRNHDLLENIRQFVFHKLDERLLQYLHGEAQRRNTETLDLRHHQITSDLTTALEVNTRTHKKLENEGKIEQSPDGIKILMFR